MTAEIQLGDLDRADPHAFSWHVPGLRVDFMAALIRSLPKAKRTYFVPAPDVAREILAHVRAAGEEGTGSLPEVLALELTARGGGGRLEDRNPITVVPTDFDWSRVPTHLRLRFRVQRGRRVLAEGFDLTALQAEQRRREVAKAEKVLARTSAAGDGRTGGRADRRTAEAAAGSRGSGAGVRDRGPAAGQRAGQGASGAGSAAAPSGAARSSGATRAPVPTREQLVDRVRAGASAVLAYAKEHLSTQEKLVLAGHQTTSDALLEAVLRVAVRGEGRGGRDRSRRHVRASRRSERSGESGRRAGDRARPGRARAVLAGRTHDADGAAGPRAHRGAHGDDDAG